MKMLLVYPGYPETFWSFRHALKYLGKRAAFPPLGLLTVAAELPDSWEIRLVDESVGPLKREDILWSDAVFVSAMLAQQDATMRVLDRCRVLGRRTILGGPMVTSDPDRFRGRADSLVLGEGEGIVSSIAEDLRTGALKEGYRSSGLCDMTNSPAPRFGLLGRGARKYASMALQWGRGCPFGCEFCNVTALFGRRMRLKRPEQVLDELQALYDLGWRGSVFFVDDNFIGNRGKAKELLGIIESWQRPLGYPFRFYTQVDIGIASHEELLDLMVRAGFFRVFIGIETPEEESLRGASKHHNVGVDIPAAVRKLHQAGIQVQGGFVLGFDQDTERTFGRMTGFIQETGIMTAMVGTLQALPDTRLYHRLKAEGRLLSVSTGDNTDGSVGFVPKGMSSSELEKGYRRVVRELYAPGRYEERLARFLRDYRPNPLLPHRLSLRAATAFLLSVVRIGIFSSARRPYWRSLRAASSDNPAALSAAVEHWIFWSHFHRVAESATVTAPVP